MNSVALLRSLADAREQAHVLGLTSICSAHPLVLEAAFEHSQAHDYPLLIEATSNQVNQFGGYTGMTPACFRTFADDIAQRVGRSSARVVLGGDHIGPNPWRHKAAEQAMDKACALVEAYVRAGFSKIHLDASMPLGDDAESGSSALAPETAAARGAQLCAAAERTCADMEAGTAPVYVIGTEVPTPGGSHEGDDGIQVTTASDFREFVRIQQEAFVQAGVVQAWERTGAVVVQPGMEFGDNSVHDYSRCAAAELSAALKEFPQLVFEGHSSDYQTRAALRQLVEDGTAILKVGPQLTFAVREGLFALEMIEREMFSRDTGMELSALSSTLDEAMLAAPQHWMNHYQGREHDITISRRFSLSDRCRYYWTVPPVQRAVQRLLANLADITIPLGLVSQYLPGQYRAVREGLLLTDPAALVKDKVREILDDYAWAVGRHRQLTEKMEGCRP